jgi:hypothetical protein
VRIAALLLLLALAGCHTWRDEPTWIERRLIEWERERLEEQREENQREQRDSTEHLAGSSPRD